MIEFIEYKFGAEIPVKPGEWYLAVYNTGIIKEPTNRVSQYSWACPYEHIVEYLIFPDSTDDENDLMSDFVALITSMTARLYGLRRGQRKTDNIIKELNNND